MLEDDYHLEPLDATESAEAGEPRRFAATFPSVNQAACELIYLGEGVRVLGPPAVQAELARITSRLVATCDSSRQTITT